MANNNAAFNLKAEVYNSLTKEEAYEGLISGKIKGRKNQEKALNLWLEDIETYIADKYGSFDGDYIEAAFWDEGCIGLVCDYLFNNFGNIDIDTPEAELMIFIAKHITQKQKTKLINECLAGYWLMECASCNHVGFYSDYNEPEEKDHRCHSCGDHNSCKKSKWGATT